jgi:uncharacterized protein DUF6176
MAERQEAVCARVRLKPGSLPRVREWAAYVASHRDDALQRLAAEGVTIESVFLDESGAVAHLVYDMRSASIEQAQRTARDSVAAIDREHERFKADAWIEVTRLERLVDLSR